MVGFDGKREVTLEIVEYMSLAGLADLDMVGDAYWPRLYASVGWYCVFVPGRGGVLCAGKDTSPESGGAVVAESAIITMYRWSPEHPKYVACASRGVKVKIG